MILTACLGVAFAQPNQDADSNMSCIERLQMPLYPPLAEKARISGSVTATVAASLDGSIHTKIAGHPLLAERADEAVEASTFRKACAGKCVTLTFNFVIDKKQDPSGPPPPVSSSYPNQFWITVPPGAN